MTNIPGMRITTRVSAMAQYTTHLQNYGDPSFISPMRTTFIAETKNAVDLDVPNAQLTEVVNRFNGRMLIGMDNSYFLHLLEPKNGHTIQSFLAQTKEQIESVAIMNRGIGYLQVGDSVPSDTKSGISLFVTKHEPVLEYLAAIVLNELRDWAMLVRATTDTGMSATVSWDDEPILL